jgi:PD-(D/E)XK nuclease superfamily
MEGEAEMVYSYTQIAQYLRCPRSYRYRYLDGWREDETRSAMAFGRCFENALGLTSGKKIAEPRSLIKEWEAYRDVAFQYRKGETWDRLLHRGIHLLERVAQDNRVCVRDPHQNLQ